MRRTEGQGVRGVPALTNPSPYGEYPNYQQQPPQQPYPSQPYEPYPQQPQQPGYQPYAQPAPGYAPQQQYPNYLPGAGPTSGMAIASLVCSLLNISIVGIILGHIALNQIKQSNGYIQGRGLAIAGLIIGYIELAAFVLIVFIIIVASLTHSGASTY